MDGVYAYYIFDKLLLSCVDFLAMGYDSSSLRVSYKTDKLT